MEVKFDFKEEEYYVEEKIENQTFRMAFQRTFKDNKKEHYNIAMGIYSKRKHADKNEELALSTGENPMQSIVMAIKAFAMLEERIKERCENKQIVVYCTWVDNRRRDAYYKFLSKKGYQYGNIGGKKCILKVYKSSL